MAEPVASSARQVRARGLRRVPTDAPGLSRRRRNGKFVYFYPDGRRVRSRDAIRRIQAAAIPPAYTDVWICADPAGHVQATARDTRGRKQYRYHPAWENLRRAAKYERMLEFGMALPQLRRRVAASLRLKGMPREKILAAVVRLLEATLVRIGNSEYARSNKSYGLTTLCNRHIEVSGSTLRFDFRGKSGIQHRVEVDHPSLARIVKECLELPGRELFQYLDESGERRVISSADVNAYLREIAGADFTAKDYRTWAGSVMALAQLRRKPFESEREARRGIVETVKAVAERLGNTPAVCRNSYIHPALLDAYRARALANGARPEGRYRGLRGDEAAFLRFVVSERRRKSRCRQ